MSETNKRENTPGLSKVKSSLDDFKKSRTREVINPTMQCAREALPVVEKSVEFREGRAGVLDTPLWLTPEVMKTAVSIEYVPEITEEIVVKPKFEKIKNDKKNSDKQEIKQVKEIKPNKVERKDRKQSDLQAVLNNIPVEDAPKKTDMFDNMSFASVVPEVKQEPAQKINVFDGLNTMQPVTVEKEPDNKEELLNARPVIVIDKVEIRAITNEDGLSAYMIDKRECSEDEFNEYMQSVRGKIISLDCKKLEFAGKTYTKQNNGSYKDSDNKILSVDDMLFILPK